MNVALLNHRLSEIADSLQQKGIAHALLGLGSIGEETARMDDFSDLDFFAIAKDGQKRRMIENLDWLTDIAPAGFHFQNTVDGHKFLYADGVFCEFAVFEAHELAGIPFSPGRVVWAEEGFDTHCLHPTNSAGHYQRSDNLEWQLGECLTNLYVGLGRFKRGETLSAFKFVQSFALERIVDLWHLSREHPGDFVDRYMPDRRIEARMPGVNSLLSRFCQGYDQTPASALAQLDWLEQNFEVNSAIAAEIRRLAR